MLSARRQSTFEGYWQDDVPMRRFDSAPATLVLLIAHTKIEKRCAALASIFHKMPKQQFTWTCICHPSLVN